MATRPKAAFSDNDWLQHKNAISDNTSEIRNEAFQQRQESKVLRENTSVKTSWDTYENNIRLSDRIDDVNSYREKIQRVIKEIDQEIENVNSVKRITEKALKAKEELVLSVLSECMSLGKERSGIDHTYSDVEVELQKEQAIAENSKKLLRQRIDEAFDQINRLKRSRFQLSENSERKLVAINVDKQQLALDTTAPNISMNNDCMRIPKQIITVDDWDNRGNRIIDLSEAELRSSEALRDVMQSSVANASRLLQDQQSSTDYAYRKRIHAMKGTKNDLDYQNTTLTDEISRVESEIEELENAIQNQLPPIYLAQTRLDNRTRRPANGECVADSAYYGLRAENITLEEAQKQLEDRLSQMKEMWNKLSNQQLQVASDIKSKEKCIDLDERALNNRKRLGNLLGNTMNTAVNEQREIQMGSNK